jgi:hypothetical protein
MKLLFKIQPAKEHGRSPIEIVLTHKTGSRAASRGDNLKAITENTDLLLPTLDRLLKKNKIDTESLKDINVEIANGAGLTSTRIVSSISKALRFDLS